MPTQDIPSFEEDFDADGFTEANQLKFVLRGEEYACQLFTMDRREEIMEMVLGPKHVRSESKFFEEILEPESWARFSSVVNGDLPPQSDTIASLINMILSASLGVGEAESPKRRTSSAGSKRNGQKRTGG